MIETIEISKLHYFNLLKDSEMLRRLERGGVDNWEYFGDALNGNEYSSDDFLPWDEFEEELKAKVWGKSE